MFVIHALVVRMVTVACLNIFADIEFNTFVKNDVNNFQKLQTSQNILVVFVDYSIRINIKIT